jgi:hypothetical protein
VCRGCMEGSEAVHWCQVGVTGGASGAWSQGALRCGDGSRISMCVVTARRTPGVVLVWSWDGGGVWQIPGVVVRA